MASYFDLDDFLAEQQKIPSWFNREFSGLKEMDTNEGGKVRPNIKVEIPFWLASFLAENEFILAEIPKCFKTRSRSAVSASPVHVQLHEICPYYYRFGCKLSRFMQDDTLLALLLKTYHERMDDIFDHMHRYHDSDASEFLRQLDQSEKELYRHGQESLAEYKRWLRRHAHKLETSEIIKSSSRKRKLPQE